jgi:hypothetical protein
MKKHSNIKQKLKNFSFQFFQRYCYKTQSTWYWYFIFYSIYICCFCWHCSI